MWKTYKMLYRQQGINLQNIQIAHAAQYQKKTNNSIKT